jgi:hypothetical protein
MDLIRVNVFAIRDVPRAGFLRTFHGARPYTVDVYPFGRNYFFLMDSQMIPAAVSAAGLQPRRAATVS